LFNDRDNRQAQQSSTSDNLSDPELFAEKIVEGLEAAVEQPIV
jgi:hypothetical protein